jgi:TonB family protein
MNRLQKKCVLATAGFHLLLLVILLVGPAFFWAKEKEDDTPVLDMIPANLVDSATTGVRSAEPPPPAPAVTPPQPTPTPPPQPAPVVTPPTPAPEPEKEKVEAVKPPKETVKPDLTPIEKPSRTRPTPQINLKLTERTVTKSTATARPAPAAPDNSRAINSALRALRNNLSSSTTIEMPGNSSASAANYAQVVKSVYEQAWTPPDDTASDDADIKVRVTIASDGSVISARIVSPSGDAKVDRSIRSTLERVQFIAPFPSGTLDKERSYIINFNLKSKRLLG